MVIGDAKPKLSDALMGMMQRVLNSTFTKWLLTTRAQAEYSDALFTSICTIIQRAMCGALDVWRHTVKHEIGMDRKLLAGAVCVIRLKMGRAWKKLHTAVRKKTKRQNMQFAAIEEPGITVRGAWVRLHKQAMVRSGHNMHMKLAQDNASFNQLWKAIHVLRSTAVYYEDQEQAVRRAVLAREVLHKLAAWELWRVTTITALEARAKLDIITRAVYTWTSVVEEYNADSLWRALQAWKTVCDCSKVQQAVNRWKEAANTTPKESHTNRVPRHRALAAKKQLRTVSGRQYR